MQNNIINKYECLCCGYYTLAEKANNTFQLCPVCYWEDDGIQLDDPTYKGGANIVSLNEARKNFQSFKASEKQFQKYVRAPLENEYSGLKKVLSR